MKAGARDLTQAQVTAFLRAGKGRADSGKAVCHREKTVGQFGHAEGSIENSTDRMNAFIQEFAKCCLEKLQHCKDMLLLHLGKQRLLGKQGQTVSLRHSV